jgi:hypothetical protein
LGETDRNFWLKADILGTLLTALLDSRKNKSAKRNGNLLLIAEAGLRILNL